MITIFINHPVYKNIIQTKIIDIFMAVLMLFALNFHFISFYLLKGIGHMVILIDLVYINFSKEHFHRADF